MFIAVFARLRIHCITFAARLDRFEELFILSFIFAKIIVRAESQYYTVSIGLWKMLEMEFINGWFTRFCAGAVLIAIPISALYIFTQKFYQEAMSGAVKG